MKSTTRQEIPVPYPVHLAAAWAWRVLVIAAAVVVMASVLYRIRIITVPMFVAILLSTMLVPPVRFLQDKSKLGAGSATAIVYVSVLAIGAVAVVLLADTISSQFKDLGPQVSKSFNQILDWLKNGPAAVSGDELSRYMDRLREVAGNNANLLSSSVTRGATLVTEVIVATFVTLILTFFFTRDGSRLVSPILERFPDYRRDGIMRALRSAYGVLGGYLRGVAATGLVDAAFIGIVLAILHVPLIAPLVIITFFGAFFPLVGATTAGVLAVLVALVNNGIVDAGLVALGVLAVQQLEGHLLQPVLVGRAVQLHPVVILFVLTSGGVVAGVLGAFLAVPLTAIIVTIWRELEISREEVNAELARRSAEASELA